MANSLSLGRQTPSNTVPFAPALTALCAAFVVAACTASAPGPPATPTPPPKVTAGRPDWPCEIARTTRLLSGPTGEVEDYGEVAVGTSCRAVFVSGERVQAFFNNNSRQIAWLAVRDVRMGREAWEALKPAPRGAALGLCLPASSDMPQDVGRTVLDQAASYLDRNRDTRAITTTMIVRSDYGAGGTLGNFVVGPPPPRPQLSELGPKPPIWDRPATRAWERIMNQNNTLLDAWRRASERYNGDVEQQLAALRALPLPNRASASGCVPQVAREYRQWYGAAPAQRLVVLLDPSRALPPPDLGVRLDGMVIVLVGHCQSGREACDSSEAGWLSAVVRAGSLSPLLLEAAGPYLDQAFAGPTPVLL